MMLEKELNTFLEYLHVGYLHDGHVKQGCYSDSRKDKAYGVADG
jgi:hypothetical protein